MRVSLGSWSFTFGPYSSHPIPFETVARRLSGAGYDAVELSGFPPHITLEAYATAAKRSELRSMLADLNLAVSAYSADFTDVNPTIAGNQERYLGALNRYIELCSEIGCPAIRVDTGAAPGFMPDDDYPAAMGLVANLWHKAAGIASAAGITLLWEFEPGFIFNKPSEVLALHTKVHHPGFRILFDTAHAYMCSVIGARQHGETETLAGGVAEFMDMLKGRIGHFHLDDSNGTLFGEETSTHCVLGEGDLDFQQLSPRIVASGVPFACVDLCFVPDAWDRIDASLVFARKVLA